MKKRRIIKIASSLVITAMCLTGIKSGIAYAVEGWTNESGEWVYLNDEDVPVTNVWKQSKDSWFYLGADGIMVRDRFIEIGSSLYYVDGDGRRAENCWVLNEEERAEGHGAGWYYFDSSGRAYRKSESSTQYKKMMEGQSYIFDESGLMVTGWMDKDGNSLNEESQPLAEGMYYAEEDGVLKTNTWMKYSDLYVNSTDGLSSNVSGRDYNDYDAVWVYFDEDSKLVRSKNERPKQKEIDGNLYGFDENGIMLPWWSKVGSILNSDKSNPTSSEPAKFYSGYDGGVLLKNNWFWMYPSDNLSEDDFDNGEYSWWYTDEKGEVYRNKIRKVNGCYYAFDGLGRMQTGFILFDNRSTYVAQYDSDAWTSDDFINGNLYGLEKADLYFFDPDELNDGSMQTGKDLKIELDDGVYTFGFGSNGIAYGNRNKLRRMNQSYYINGLKLEAAQDYGYGVVWDEAAEHYRVVNSSGVIITGDKKVVKDKEGGWLLILNGCFAARVEDEDKPRWINGPEGTGFYHYDRKQQRDPYAGGFIAGYDSDPDTEGLPEEERLNFE